jgi:hypothetical protein
MNVILYDRKTRKKWLVRRKKRGRVAPPLGGESRSDAGKLLSGAKGGNLQV